MKKRIIGIYQIYCIISKEKYIGSSIDIKERWRRHKKDLRGNRSHSIILQRAWNKYGEDNFEFSLIEECDVSNLLQKEQFYLDNIKPVYNICTSAFSTFEEKIQKKLKRKKDRLPKD